MSDTAEHIYCVVTARDEQARIGETLAALAGALRGATLLVADDGSRDATAQVARESGAQVLSSTRPMGKGAAATRAAREALRQASSEAVVLLCDGDLGGSAAALAALVRAVGDGEADLTVGVFRERVGGGFGLARGFARWAIERACGYRAAAPLSGQRALRARTLERVLPFADGFGMELGITIDALRAGARVKEIELHLTHRATGRTLAGFAHRARQLLDAARAYAARR